MNIYTKSFSIVVLLTSASFVSGGAFAGDMADQAKFKPKHYASCYGSVENAAAAPAAMADAPAAQLRAETTNMRTTLKGVESAQDCYTTALNDLQSMKAGDAKAAGEKLAEIKAGTHQVGAILASATTRFSEQSTALYPKVSSDVAPAAGKTAGMMDSPESEATTTLLNEGNDLLERARKAKERQEALEAKIAKAG